MKHNNLSNPGPTPAYGGSMVATRPHVAAHYSRLFEVLLAVLAAALAPGSGGFGSPPPALPVAEASSTNAPTVNTPVPAIAFANPIFDFGKLESGHLVQHDFWFTNTGQAVLELRDVRPSCGCTLAANWDRSVQPGKPGRVPVQLNYGSFSGDLLKTVIVVCNDPAQSNVVLQIKGNIWKPVEITPAFVLFTPAPDSLVPDSRVVRILNNTDEPLTLSELDCTNQAFQPTLTPLKAGKEFELKIAFLPPFNPGTVSTTISLKTSVRNAPVITLSACGVVQPPVTSLPPQVTLPPGPLTAAVTFKVTIQNHSTNSLALSEPGGGAEGVDARLQEIAPGQTFQLALSFPQGFQAPASQKIEARVKTSNPLLPVLRIPVLQGQSLSAALSAGEHSAQAGNASAAPRAN